MVLPQLFKEYTEHCISISRICEQPYRLVGERSWRTTPDVETFINDPYQHIYT